MSAILALALLAGGAGATPPMRARLFASGLSFPVGAVAAPGDSQHLFVVELEGRIRTLDPVSGAIAATPFLDIRTQVVKVGDGGLLGICFDPGYAANGYFYVFYNAAPNPPNDRVLARYHATPGSGVADAGSATLLMQYPRTIGHNGGWIGFNPANGYMYLSTGDGGTNGTLDAPNNAQTQTRLAGKILRIDVHGGDDFPADPQRNYHIPASNPFAAGGGAPEVWSSGLRNPWRCAIDGANGDFYITSNGEDQRETVYYEPATSGGARNYGWRCTEGTLCTGLGGCVCGSPAITPPVYEYTHQVGYSIIGGPVYHGAGIPVLQGKLMFADFVTGQISSLRVLAGQATEVVEHTPDLGLPGGNAILTIGAFGENAAGELLVADVFGGNLYRIVPYSVCPADFNGVGGLTVQDIFDFLNAWFGANPRADYNGQAGITVQDIFDFLGGWFAGCS